MSLVAFFHFPVCLLIAISLLVCLIFSNLPVLPSILGSSVILLKACLSLCTPCLFVFVYVYLSVFMSVCRKRLLSTSQLTLTSAVT
jgi:hypothetical protein